MQLLIKLLFHQQFYRLLTSKKITHSKILLIILSPKVSQLQLVFSLTPNYFWHCRTALYAGLGREIASAFVSGLLPNKHHSNQTKRDTKDYMDLLGKCVLQADTALRNVPDKETFIVTLGGLKYAYQVNKTYHKFYSNYSAWLN